MKVVQVLLSSATAYGGPPAVVRDLTGALAELGVEGSVVTLSERGSASVQFSSGVFVRISGNAAAPKLGLPTSGSFIRNLFLEIRTADLVHLHDMWHFPQLAGAIASRLRDRPYVASPHGALEPWCLSQHVVSKALAWRTFQKSILNGAERVHVLTEQEQRTVRQLGVISPTPVIPSGVNLPSVDELREKALSENSKRAERYSPFVLYLGRLDPKKQVEVLLESFMEVAKVHKRISLVIAGPDPSGLWTGIEVRVKHLGLTNRVHYLGFVDEITKFGILSGAELFVQPSRSEGLSMAVLEALACGTPAIVSQGCNIPEIEKFRAGLVVPATVSHFSKAMLDVLLDNDKRTSMKGNARRLIESKFTARAMAIAMKRVYEESIVEHGHPRGSTSRR